MRLRTSAVCTVMGLLSPSVALALTISFSPPSGGIGSAKHAEAAFLAGLASYVTESFEAFAPPGGSNGPGNQGGLVQPSFTTAIGTFSQSAPPPRLTGDLCVPTCGDGLAVLSRRTSPFDGRFAVGPGRQWLDTNDASGARITFAEPYGAIGFFLTDMNDFARLRIDAFGGEPASATLGHGYPSGFSTYVWMTDPAGIRSIDLTMDAWRNDGFGIDRLTVAAALSPEPVPEPGTLLLLGAGLLVLGRRRRRAPR